jgi:hypothetical protein
MPVMGKTKSEYYVGKIKGYGIPVMIKIDKSKSFKKMCDLAREVRPLVNLSDANITEVFSSHIDYENRKHVHYLVMAISNSPTLA